MFENEMATNLLLFVQMIGLAALSINIYFCLYYTTRLPCVFAAASFYVNFMMLFYFFLVERHFYSVRNVKKQNMPESLHPCLVAHTPK